MLWELTHTCTRFLQLDDFVVYTRKHKDKSLIQAAAAGKKGSKKKEVINPLQIPIGKGIVGLSALRQAPQLVTDTSQNNDYLIDDQQRLSELAVPIVWNNKVIGVIDSEHQNKHFFSSTYVDLFCVIAGLCAPFMDQLIKKEQKKINPENKYYHQFIHLLKEEKIYRDKQLSLNSVAERLEITPIYLSNIINQQGELPFATLVNKYRIQEVKTLIQQGQHQKFNILSIAYQAGFNSKSSFNSNFKNQTQQTPSEYIKSQTSKIK